MFTKSSHPPLLLSVRVDYVTFAYPCLACFKGSTSLSSFLAVSWASGEERVRVQSQKRPINGHGSNGDKLHYFACFDKKVGGGGLFYTNWRFTYHIMEEQTHPPTKMGKELGVYQGTSARLSSLLTVRLNSFDTYT